MIKEIGNNNLRKIHSHQNYRKAISYWVGFLEGVLACKEITSFEAHALKEQSHDLLSRFFDEDAQDLVEDLIQDWPDLSEELIDFMKDIIVYKKEELGITDDLINENIFYGFLKGIACDNEVNVKEVNALLNRFYDKTWEKNIVKEDPRIRDIFSIAKLSIQDNIIEKHESEELCNYIAKVVGDSFADTGISEQSDIPQLDGMVQSFEEINFEGSEFCLTGQFQVPKSILAKSIQNFGGTVHRGIRRNTSYLVLSNAGSEHYMTPNAGTKILTAQKLRSENGQPEFIMESTILHIIHEI